MSTDAVRSGLSFDAVTLVGPPKVWISETNWQWRVTIPDYYNLWHVLRGTGWMEVAGRRHVLTPGRAFVLSPGQHVRAMHNPSDPIHNFAAHFRPVPRGRTRGPGPEFPLAHVAVRDTALFEDMARQAVRLADAGDTLALQQAAALVLALAAQVVRDANLPALDPVELRIRPIIEQMNANPGRHLSVPELARKAGLSTVQFTRRFRRLTGTSPNLYLVRRRIERASQLIQQSPLKISEIADSLGYSDVFFFSRQFKRILGHPPSHLRR
jgi:AraC family transcriptional regulator of arabinose operon